MKVACNTQEGDAQILGFDNDFWWWLSSERVKIMEMVKELLRVVVLLFLAPFSWSFFGLFFVYLSWLMLVGIYLDGWKV